MSNKEQVLDILQEECAELIAVISKIRRFGIDNHNPFIEPIKTNRTHLIEEIGDVLALIGIITEKYDITADELTAAKERKIEKLKVWSNIFEE